MESSVVIAHFVDPMRVALELAFAIGFKTTLMIVVISILVAGGVQLFAHFIGKALNLLASWCSSHGKGGMGRNGAPRKKISPETRRQLELYNLDVVREWKQCMGCGMNSKYIEYMHEDQEWHDVYCVQDIKPLSEMLALFMTAFLTVLTCLRVSRGHGVEGRRVGGSTEPVNFATVAVPRKVSNVVNLWCADSSLSLPMHVRSKRKGDGNCFWRAVFGKRWSTTKKDFKRKFEQGHMDFMLTHEEKVIVQESLKRDAWVTTETVKVVCVAMNLHLHVFREEQGACKADMEVFPVAADAERPLKHVAVILRRFHYDKLNFCEACLRKNCSVARVKAQGGGATIQRISDAPSTTAGSMLAGGGNVRFEPESGRAEPFEQQLEGHVTVSALRRLVAKRKKLAFDKFGI
eukprot:2511048-Amphidinium_carterae.1